MSSPLSPAGGWQAWFDGAAAPNPGPIGLGGVLLAPSGERQQWSRRAGGQGCNNEAELLALAEVLERAQQAGARQLTVYGDSDFVIQHIQGHASTVVPHLAALVAQVQTRLAHFEAVAFCWIPRHRNGEADCLSRQALGLASALPTRPISKRRR